jgi:hypothetical protein
MKSFPLIVAGASLAVFMGAGGYTLVPRQVYDAACDVKGNISINTGERIYHVPGQEYYLQTKISPQHGERWFCSEAEARAAGWRKARS